MINYLILLLLLAGNLASELTFQGRTEWLSWIEANDPKGVQKLKIQDKLITSPVTTIDQHGYSWENW